MDMPLLTIVVPVYNVEEHIEKCIRSLQEQSYQSIEIVCVNDNSPDASAQIIQRLAEEDGRIRYVRHEKNEGLFRARITGMKAARGDVIAFVDSDDFVSVDWFRPLIKTLTADGADMVVGNTVNVDESGVRTYFNHYRSFNRNREPLEGEVLLRSFFAQQGECFIWHTVWNKVYSRKLIGRALPFLEKMELHLIMGEDILFSTVFYALAEKLSFCDNDCYFYYRHGKASTSLYQSKERLHGYVRDIGNVFALAERFLEQTGKLREVKRDFELFKEKYFRIWSGNIRATRYENDREIVGSLLESFQKEKLSQPCEHEFYFYEQTTQWDEKFEELRYKICKENVKIISFDIFDTLIERPFWTPDDLFLFVGEKIGRIVAEPETFAAMRKEAETKCRLFARMADAKAEDVTLTEIYKCMSDLFGYTAQDSAAMLEAEKEAELNLCMPRRAGRELFELAKFIGRRVVLTSDIYLEQPLVEKMLRKCGIEGYDRLYLSSAFKKLKAGGGLFKVLKKEEKAAGNSVLHIGDNWESDIMSSQKEGLLSLFFPKAVETYTNNISNIYTGDAFKQIYEGAHKICDSRCVMEQLPLRCLLSCAAYGCFDDPFRSFHAGSLYDADAYFIGFAALGMHLLGLAKFIRDTAEEKGYDRIVFLARDGYLVKKVFDMLFGDTLQTSYFYANRKTLLPFAVKNKEDLFGLYRYFDLDKTSPRDVLEILEPLWGKLTAKQALLFHKRGIDLQKPFYGRSSFFDFAQAACEVMAEQNTVLQNEKTDRLRAAIASEFRGKCACFDIGYSGRLQAILCGIAEKPIDVFYLHDNGSSAQALAKRNGFRIYDFYRHTPAVTSVLREYLISQPDGSCIGYEEENGKLRFLFEKEQSAKYSETYAVRELQRGALDYCRFVKRCFKDDIDRFSLRPLDVSVSFENFLWNAEEFDRKVFSNSYLEDKVYGGYARKNFFDVWNWHLAQLKKNGNSERAIVNSNASNGQCAFLVGKPLWLKGLFYWLFDREKFRTKYRARKRMKRLARRKAD